MKATEIIKQLTTLVNEHGDFDLKVGYCDDDSAYVNYWQPEDITMSIDWDDRDNEWNGCWLFIDVPEE